MYSIIPVTDKNYKRNPSKHWGFFVSTSDFRANNRSVRPYDFYRVS